LERHDHFKDQRTRKLDVILGALIIKHFVRDARCIFEQNTLLIK